MGTTTPNIGIYIPAAGETNYDQSFSSGMVNVDQHDHSGGPNKGMPIATNGLGAFSVTFDKLNANVVDPTTGVGVSGALPNQIVMLDPLKSIFQLAPTTGFLTIDGTIAHARTFQDTASVTWTNADGVAGNPSATVNIAGISPVTVPNGGTGLTTLSTYALLAGGTTATGNVQQVSGLGTAAQVLTSNGAGTLPTWQNLPTPAAQTFYIATITLTASQFRNLKVTPQELIPNPGVGKVIVPYKLWGKLNFGSSAFSSGSSVRTYFGTSLFEVGIRFASGAFTDSASGYYFADDLEVGSASGIIPSSIENQNIVISVNSSDFTSGTGCTVSFYCTYSIMQI